MRYFLALCFYILTFSIKGQIIVRLHYKPKGQIIKFYFDSLTIYTDTTSLFKFYNNKSGAQEDRRVRNLVIRKLNENQRDTISFSGDLIPYNESIDDNFGAHWYVHNAILFLLKKGKLIIFDQNGQVVKTLVTRKFGTKEKGNVYRSYINNDTKERLFNEVIYRVNFLPHW